MILMDGNALMAVFEDRVALHDLLRHKRCAAHTGQVFIGTSPAMIGWGARPGLDDAQAAPNGIKLHGRLVRATAVDKVHLSCQAS
jgi:hypothetical protein